MWEELQQPGVDDLTGHAANRLLQAVDGADRRRDGDPLSLPIAEDAAVAVLRLSWCELLIAECSEEGKVGRLEGCSGTRCRDPTAAPFAVARGGAGSVIAEEMTATPKDALDDMFAEPPQVGPDVAPEASNQSALEGEGLEDITTSISPAAVLSDDGGMAHPAMPAAAPKILRRLDGLDALFAPKQPTQAAAAGSDLDDMFAEFCRQIDKDGTAA